MSIAQAPPPAGDVTDGRGSRSKLAYPLAVVVVVGVMTIAFTARALLVTGYTGNDELQHVDAVLLASRGTWPGYGSKVSDEVARDISCRGLDPAEVSPPPREPSRAVPVPCGEPAPLPEAGESYEAGQPPLYYLGAGTVSAALRAIGRDGPQLLALRLANLPWLWAAAGLVLAALRRVVNRWVALGALATFFLSPPVIEHAATVSNDVAVLAAGALLAWLVVRFENRWDRTFVASLFAAGFLAGLIKSTTVLPVLTSMLFLIGRALVATPHSRRRLMIALAPAAGWACSTGSWGTYVGHVSTVLPPDLQPFARLDTAASFPVELIASLLPVGPLRLLYAPGINTDSLLVYQLLASATLPLLILGCGSAILRWQSVVDARRSRTALVDRSTLMLLVGVATAVMMFLGGPVIVVLSELGTQVPHGLQPRFTLGMVGFLALTLASQSDVRARGRTTEVGPALPILVTLAAVTVIALTAYLPALG